jgi:outer membrane receptor protein involved in Fe transport
MPTRRPVLNHFLTAILCATALPAYAEDLTTLSIDQLLSVEIVTASKFPQKVSDAPSSVSVVTADEIKAFGYRTLADILRGMRGVYVSYDRNYSYVGTRGAGQPGDYNTRLLLLVDGQRLNDSIYGQSSVGAEFPVDVEMIERVEYIPGPGSAVYGSNAFFGVINIITKKARALAGVTASMELASYHTRKGTLIVGKRFDNGGEGLVSISDSVSAGIDRYFSEYDDAASNHGVATHLDTDRYKRVFAKYSFGDMTLTGFLGDRTKGVPTASFGQQFNDPRSFTEDRYLAASAVIQHSLSTTLDLYASLNFTRYQYVGDYAYAPDVTGLNRDLANSNVVISELRFMDRALSGQKLIYGIETSNATRRQQVNLNVEPYLSILSTDNPMQGYGIYVQDEIEIGNNLILNVGLRRDHNAESSNTNNPRVGLIYRITPDVTTKLLYGTAFRSANALESYYVTDALHYKKGPALEPEHIKTYEFVAEYFPRQNFRSSASVFAYRMNNLISLVTDPADQLLYYKNVNAASARGVELEAELLGLDGSRLRGSTSFQFTKDDVTGNRLTNSPTQLAKLNYSRPFLTKTGRIGLEAQYTGKRSTVLGGEVGGFSVVNLTLSGIKPVPKVELDASLYNLLNKNFSDPPSDEHFDNSTPPRFLRSIRQDGRVVRMNLCYRF